MDRCPHCKSPGPSRPVCGVCGQPVDLPAARDPVLDGLEPTRAPQVTVITVPVPGLEARVPTPPVIAEPLAGLERTTDVLGDVSIPAGADEPATPGVCRRCGAGAGSGIFCDRCGFRLVPSGRVDVDDEPDLRCLSCGTLNRPGAPVCAACGQRMHA